MSSRWLATGGSPRRRLDRRALRRTQETHHARFGRGIVDRPALPCRPSRRSSRSCHGRRAAARNSHNARAMLMPLRFTCRSTRSKVVAHASKASPSRVMPALIHEAPQAEVPVVFR